MATPKDVQDLLRLLTTGRNKIPMLAAMGRVKELRNADLPSIAAIATSNLPTIQKALLDEKAAKALLAACKAAVKKETADPTSTSSNSKRPFESGAEQDAKRHKSVYSLPDEPLTPTQLEASLALPMPSRDEAAISKCVVVTNRAPLVLAFAVQLLKYTMPRQPMSGRLSLAQAVVSVNAKSKAISLGLERGGGGEGEGWPKVRIMGREVAVLKRSGYEWEDENTSAEGLKKEDDEVAGSASTIKQENPSNSQSQSTGWTVSASVTSKKSTFIARSIPIFSPAEAKSVLYTLLAQNPDLAQAGHNITAYRVQTTQGLIEDSNDDGESGGGKHLLGVLKENNAIGVLLLVTRWYGGIMLGPDRWRIMTQVSRDALSQRLRIVGSVGDEALWGLDLSEKAKPGEMATHRPEGAKAYIMKAFPSLVAEELEGTGKKKKRTAAELAREKEENLGLLLGALGLLFESWVEYLGREELDRRAWGWYVSLRPEVEAGPAGWGGKGELRLERILKLRRPQE